MEKILRHRDLWREPTQRGPPVVAVDDSQPRELSYVPEYFDSACA